LADVNLGQLKERSIVVEASGVTSLESYGDLRLLDSELEQGVQALYSDEDETIVAFVFSRGTFTEDKAQEWVREVKDTGVNLSVQAGLPQARNRPTFMLAGGVSVVTAIEDVSFEDIRGLLCEALENAHVTMPDGSYRYPWLTDVFVDYCIIQLGERYHKLPYIIDDANEVSFGELQEVMRVWQPVAQPEDTSLAADMGGTPRVFSMALRDPVSLPADIGADDNGLIWKEIFRVSTTFRPQTGTSLAVDQSMIDAMYEAFEGRALNHVAITASTHHVETDGIVPASETVGFVDRLVKVGQHLYGGLDVRDEDTREQLDKGLIRDCSVYIWADFHDRSHPDTVWPWALVHLLLTNYPQLPDLQGFGVAPTAVAASFSGVQFTQYREELMTKEQNRDQTPALSPEDVVLLEQARVLRAQGFALDGALERQVQLRAKARGLEVSSIVAAMEGRVQRDDVTVIEGTRHYPVVVQAVQAALQPDGLGFDIADDGTSPVDGIVLAIVNALPKEARFSLNAPVRPDRSMADVSGPGREPGHRTAPIDAETARALPDEAIDAFDKSLGG